MEAVKIALLAKEAGDDKKAINPVVLDVSGISRVTDFFVILSGNTEIQVQAIAEAVKEKLEAQEVTYIRREGFSEGRWVLLDYGDVVVHVMHREEREYYDLERLWGDAVII
ncbi:MAG: ribosome silencing factor [Bacillota bacterium]